MTAPASDSQPAAPRAVLLLPLALRLHIAEEWFGGFPSWSQAVALVGLNAVLHAVASLVTGSYSPGTVTGLLLYLPLSAVLLRSSARRLSRPVFAGSLLMGVLVHALATLSALR